jgi:DNA repair exonuclease SbcCD ATPase subunit
MPYTVALPDGRTVEFPDSVPKERAAEILREQFPTPSAGFSLRDLFTSFGQGAVGSTKALTDVAGAGNAASQQLEQAGEALQSRLTPERQAELERQQARAKKAAESGSTWEEIKAAAQSVAEAPLQSAAQALGSFVPYLPTLFLGPGAAALGLGARATAAATQVARAAPAAIGTAQGAGAVKGAIYERVYEAERKDGVPEEQARAKAVAAQDYFGQNIDQILLGGGAGFVAGKFGAEKLLTPGAAAAAERSMLGRVGTALATDVPTEAFQGGQEQLAANLALQRTGRDVPTFQGVAAQATQEGLMGALGSAPVAAIQGPGAALAREEQARRAEEIAQRQATIDAEAAQRAAFRQSPQYLDDLEQRFTQLKETERKLNEATKGKVDKNDPLAVEKQRRAKEALAEFKKSDEYTNLIEEFTEAYDQLAPRAQERARVAEEEQRVARVGAAPEGAQLDVFGEPAGVQDRSVPGQIKSLEQYISSFDKQIKAAQSAGDQNQVASLQQKQDEARQQIAALFPDAALLSETKQRAQTRLEDYQTKIKELAQAIAGNPNAEEIAALQAELSQLNAQLAQVPQMAGLVAPAARERTQQRLQAQFSEQIAKVQARIAALQTTPNKTAEQYRQLRQLNESASQIRSAIAEIDRTQTAAEKYRPSEVIKPVDKTKRLADLTKKLEKQSELGEDITQTLAQIEEAQGLQEQPSLFGEEDLRPVETRDLGDLIAEERKQIQDLQKMALMFAEQVRQAQAQRGVVRSTKQELLEEARQKIIEIRRRNQTLVDIDRLQGLVQQLSAQVTTLQTQNKPVPDALTNRIATIRKDLDTLMSTVKAAQQKPEPVQSRTVLPEGDERVTDAELTAQRDRDIEGLLDQYLAPALGVTETQETLTVQGPEGERQIRLTTLGGEKPVTATEVSDVVEQREETVNAFVIEFAPALREAGTDAERRDAQRKIERVTNAVVNLSLVEVDLRRKRAGGDLLNKDIRQELASLVAAELDPNVRKLSSADINAKIDEFVKEFSAGTTEEVAAKTKDRRVATGNRPAALEGADVGARIAYNENQIKQIRQDLKYAGRPTDPEKVAARDRLVAELQPLLAENKALRERYNRQQEVTPVQEETGEVAEMRQELAGIERALASGMFKGDAVQRLEAARDALQARLADAAPEMGPPTPTAEDRTSLLPGMSQRFAQFEYRPVAPEALAKAKTDYVKATQKIEDIRSALGRLDEMGPKYFQEVATTYQQNIDAANRQKQNLADTLERLQKQLTEAKPEDAPDLQERINNIKEQQEIVGRKSKELEQAEAEVKRFLNLAKLAGTSSAQDLRPSLERARDEALADKDRKEAAVKDLEKRQRMYEQQEAAKSGVDLGDIEAERIAAGETKGFLSGRGKALAEKPKSKRSWVVSTDSKAKIMSPGQAGKMEAATQNALDLLEQAKKETAAATQALEGAPTSENLTPLKTAQARLEAEVNARYTPAQAAEIAGEIALLKDKLASFATAPEIADVASAYEKAVRIGASLPANSPKSAPMRVAQLMVDATVKENKAANTVKTAAQAVTEAEQKFDAAFRALKAAEKKLKKLKDPKKIQGVKLQIGNLYGVAQSLRDSILNAIQERGNTEKAYMAARLERLVLVQQMGEHAKTELDNLNKQLAGAANTVTTLTKERDAALDRENKIRSKLTTAEAAAEKAKTDAKNAREAALNAERAATEKARNDALDAAATARQQAARAQSGLGLPGRRVERSTAGQLMTAAQADIKKRLATAETNLSKAMRSGNTADIKAATAKVQEITLELDQIYSKAPVTTTEIGTGQEKKEVIEDAFEPAPVEGTRLASRREGPSVRYTRGGSKAIMQSGAVKLRAAGLSQEAANALSLYVAKNRITGAKKAETKEQYQKAFDELTKGMTDDQVSAMLAEGKRLMGLGPTAELIAKRTTYKDALLAVSLASTEVNRAKTPVTKELAEDALVLAEQRSNAAEIAYNLAKDRYEMSMVKTAKTAAKETVESFFEDAEAVAPSALSSAVGDELVPMVYTTASRNPSDLIVQEAIRDGRLLDALDRLAVAGANDLIKQSARELREFVLRTKVRIDPNLTDKGKAIPAAFNPAENIIFFRPKEIGDENIIHEVTHAATMRVMRMPNNQLTDRQRNAKKEIEALFAKLKKDSALAGEYGLENAEEFVSEVQSNVDFRAAIDKMPWYKRLWHAIVRLFSDAPIESVSERASRMVRELYLPSAKIATPTGLVPSVFRGAQPSEFTMVGRPAGAMKTLTGNLFGLAGRVQYIDRLAAAERAFVEAQKAGNLSSLEAENAQYFMRLGDMTTQAAGQFITNGPVRIVKDNLAGNVEERYESQTGATLLQVSEFIERAAAAGLGNAKAVEDMLTVKIAGDRANAIPRGWERLFSENPSKAKAEYDTVVARINDNPEAKKFIDAATAEYKAYNNGLMDFAEQTGFLSADEAKRLKKSPYIPYYRVENGEVKLFVDRETPLVIGNIKNNPDLQQLLGDNTQILPLLTSAVQNTFMLTRMGLRNKATQETASALEKSGFVTKMGKGYGPEGVNTVRYKYKGEPYFATVDSDQFGIPAELIVKGMEGIKTTIPDIVRLLGIPANWLRTFITRSPAYVLRQLVRDPLNAAITGGVDGVPVLNAFKQLAKMKAGRNPSADALMRGLTVSSNIFTGNEEDMQKFLEAASTGRGKWAKLMGTFDQLALESDAATRTAIYEDSLRKGFSERQAQFRAMEAQNFSRRGLSPSTQVLSTLVPFFNAQIQGLDVLYRSFSGQMPFSERLEIQKKIVARGTLLMVTALSYAFLMRDNEEYKKASPEERYSSFFVPLPGVKEMFKIPIPYEVGLLFKALPEALLDSILGDTKAEEAAKGIFTLLLQSAPGVIPAAGKPLIEAAYGTTTFGPIESQREKMLPTEQRYREATPEVLKTLGSYTGAVGISPLMLEHLARGYTSTLGISVLRMLDPVLGSAMEGEKATTPLSKMPFIGGLFQTGDGRFLIERAYSRMEEITQAVAGYKDLESRGRRAEAQAFAQRNSDLLAAADMAGMFRQRSGQMFSDERAIRSDPSLSRAQKDALLEKIKAAQQEEARQFYAASERTTRQQPRP